MSTRSTQNPVNTESNPFDRGLNQLEKSDADFAVVRTDQNFPTSGLSAAILREDPILFIRFGSGASLTKPKLQGYSPAGKTFKVHLDGYDQRDLLSGKGPNKRRQQSGGKAARHEGQRLAARKVVEGAV